MAKVSQATPVKDIVINQGEDYSFQLKIYEGTADNKTVVDITGYTFTCKIRDEAESDTVILTATCTILDAVNGLVDIFFSADDSDNVSLDGTYYGDLAKYTYDVFMKNKDEKEKRILCGYAYISPSVSNR